MQVMNWSKNDCLKLIELYRSEPVLWDPQNEFYSSATRKKDAWTSISEAMETPQAELFKNDEKHTSGLSGEIFEKFLVQIFQ